MREFITKNLLNTEGLQLSTILLNHFAAMMAAFFVMLAYKITYSGAAYSRKFNISLGMIILVTTSIMSVISNNVALSLGMVGALSIIRFRTAVKDVRDSAYIFWAISIGIGCGVSQFMLIAAGSLSLFLFLLLTRQIIPDNRELLVIRGNLDQQDAVRWLVEEYFHRAAHQVVRSASGQSFELVYGISAGKLRKAEKQNMVDIIEKLMNAEGVSSANLIEQTDDIGR